jgi:FkbM family methyltransferase
VEHIPSLFEPFPQEVAPGAIPDEATLPVALSTPQEQWSYTLRFSRLPAGVVPTRAVLVRVALMVNSGMLGVGCLNLEETDFIDEALVGPTPEATTAEIVIARPAAAGALVVRNASSAGASGAMLLGLECFALEERRETDRAPALSDPRPCANWSRYYGTRGSTIAERLRVQEYASLAAPRVIRWADGLCFRVLPHDQLSRALYVSRTYEPNTLSVLRRFLREGDTFLDVGANVGIISLAASRWVGAAGRVYAFEPSRREFDNLVDTLERNAVTNVRPLPLAVTARSGSAELRVASASHAGLNTLGDAFPYEGVDVHSLERVNTTTLDEFAEAERIARIAVIKLDVEGAELAALTGARRVLGEHRPVLVVEVFSRSLEANGATPEALEQLLGEARYRLFAIDDSTARLAAITSLDDVDEQNIVALPIERGEQVKTDSSDG